MTSSWTLRPVRACARRWCGASRYLPYTTPVVCCLRPSGRTLAPAAPLAAWAVKICRGRVVEWVSAFPALQQGDW